MSLRPPRSRREKSDQNIDPAVAAVRMREKTRVRVFCLFIDSKRHNIASGFRRNVDGISGLKRRRNDDEQKGVKSMGRTVGTASG